ncbi:hypothetical protein TNCV_671621 [Trichonephila clavipes]|nr:hypothetical protein TNCV_671621 [Trichonephila clavipes]
MYGGWCRCSQPRVAISFCIAVAECDLALSSNNRTPAQATILESICLIATDLYPMETATADSDVVQSGRPIFDDFFQHLWPYIGNNTANVVFQMVKRLWLIRIDQ